MNLFTRTLRAEMIKLATLRWGLGVYVVSAIALTVGFELTAHQMNAGTITVFGHDATAAPTVAQAVPVGLAYLGAVYGAYLAGSESRGGQFSVTVLACPHRGLGLSARTIVHLVLVLALSAGVLTFRSVAFTPESFKASALGSIRDILDPLLFIGGISILGNSLASAWRSMPAGVALIVGAPAVVSPLLAQMNSPIVYFLPHESGLTTFFPALRPSDSYSLPTAGLIFATWVAAAYVLAILLTRRKDVS